jgi:hypothetical protein
MLDKVYTDATPRLIEFHKNYKGSKIGDADNAEWFDNCNSLDEPGWFGIGRIGEFYYKERDYTKLSEQEFIEFMELEDTVKDNVNKPSHYTQGGIEPIDYILANEMNFLEGNVIKYVTRYKHKNGLEDLKKSEFYLKKLIEGYGKD